MNKLTRGKLTGLVALLLVATSVELAMPGAATAREIKNNTRTSVNKNTNNNRNTNVNRNTK